MKWQKIHRDIQPQTTLTISSESRIGFSAAALRTYRAAKTFDLFISECRDRIGIKFYEDGLGDFPFSTRQISASGFLRPLGLLDKTRGKRYPLHVSDEYDVDALIILAEGVSTVKTPATKMEPPTPARGPSLNGLNITKGRANQILKAHAGGASKKQLCDGFPDVPPAVIEKLLARQGGLPE